MKWIQVLNATTNSFIVNHWIQWFRSKGIAYELRTTNRGSILMRAMTSKQYDAYLAISDRKDGMITTSGPGMVTEQHS